MGAKTFQRGLAHVFSFTRPSTLDPSRYQNRIENLLNNRICCHRLGFGLVCENQSMPQYVRPDAFDVLRSDVLTSLQERPGFGCDGQVNGCSRRRPKLDEMFYVELVFLRGTRREY